MKKLFFAVLTVIVTTVPAFAAVVNGGLSTWGQVSGSGFLSQETTHQAYAPGFIIGTYQGATMATWGGNASAQQMTGYTHVDDITIVDTYTGASATSPWYGIADVSAGSETTVAVPGVFVGMENSADLLTIGLGSASGSQSSSVIIMN